MRNAFIFWSVLLCSLPAMANDWAHWRGPEQNGISREKNLVDDWSLDTNTSGKNVLWVSEIGGRSTPIILNGRMYLNCRTHHNINDPNERIHAREQVVCWDAKTGEILWRDEFNVFQTDIPQSRIGWASMVGDPETGNVYVHSVSGLFRCYSADGEVLWERSLFEEFGRVSGYGGRTHTPIIDEDRVIVSFLSLNWGEHGQPPSKHRYYAFDKRTGDLLWASAPGDIFKVRNEPPPQDPTLLVPKDTNYSTPIVAVIEGVRMLIGGTSDGHCYAMNARTGEPLWVFFMGRRATNVSPVVDGKYVYIAHGEDNVDNNLFGRIQCIDASGRGNITETHSVWRVDDIKVGYASLLLKDGILYAVSDTGSLLAYDSATGEFLWEHKLGTVGKGSPVWADGKIYVMEVNGNIHILRPSREKCESLSHVELMSPSGDNTDEIYASPAIADGRIYFVTRDRTICIGNPDEDHPSDPIPPMPEEVAPSDEIAKLHLVPYEVMLRPGESVKYELRAYDANGRFLKTLEPTLEIDPDFPLSQVHLSGNQVEVPMDAGEQGGNIMAKVGDVVAKARIRVFPNLPWEWNFDDYAKDDAPPTWVAGGVAFDAEPVDGNVALKILPVRGRPSTYVWLGPPTMSGYTIQADTMLKEQRRQMSNVGLTAERYNLILKGNTQKLALTTWPPHIRMDKEIRFKSEPNVWYRMKLRVDPVEGGCQVRGKVWPRDEQEPEAWTIEAFDPHPNGEGSPGLYNYFFTDAYFDNVSVTEGSQ